MSANNIGPNVSGTTLKLIEVEMMRRFQENPEECPELTKLINYVKDLKPKEQISAFQQLLANDSGLAKKIEDEKQNFQSRVVSETVTLEKSVKGFFFNSNTNLEK